MAIYRCFIRGENFPFLIDGAWKQLGFHTTRFVEASSAEDAESAALAALKGDDVLRRDPGTPGMEHACAFFEDIVEVAEVNGPNSGFTLFEGES